MAFKKKSGKKLLIILFSILIISIGIYFLNNQLLQKPRGSGNLNNKNTLQQSVIKAKNISGYVFEGTKIIKNVAPFDNCLEGEYCIQYTNNTLSWYAAVNPRFKVNLTGRFAVKITLRGETDFAGINLIGKFAEKDQDWWKGRKSLNIYALYDNIEIYADTGFARDPILITSEKVETNENGFLELILIFDDKGKNLIITDSKGTIINTIDVNQSTSGNFPEGIFPDSKFYLGISQAPNAKLTILEFYGYPLIYN